MKFHLTEEWNREVMSGCATTTTHNLGVVYFKLVYSILVIINPYRSWHSSFFYWNYTDTSTFHGSEGSTNILKTHTQGDTRLDWSECSSYLMEPDFFWIRGKMRVSYQSLYSESLTKQFIVIFMWRLKDYHLVCTSTPRLFTISNWSRGLVHLFFVWNSLILVSIRWIVEREAVNAFWV